MRPQSCVLRAALRLPDRQPQIVHLIFYGPVIHERSCMVAVALCEDCGPSVVHIIAHGLPAMGKQALGCNLGGFPSLLREWSLLFLPNLANCRIVGPG